MAVSSEGQTRRTDQLVYSKNTSPRFDRTAPERRAALLDAAAHEFAVHGYDGASTHRILLAAGLSKGAFYYYFDDKADLAAAVLARKTEHWIEQFGALPMPDTPKEFWDAIEELTERGMAELREAPERSDVMARLGVAAGKNPELMERLGPFFARARANLVRFFRRGQQVGAVRTDLSVDVVMTLAQSAKQALTLALLPADRAPTTEELDEFSRVHIDCMRRLISPRPSSDAPSERHDERGA